VDGSGGVERVVAHFKVLCYHTPGRCEENHDNYARIGSLPTEI